MRVRAKAIDGQGGKEKGDKYSVTLGSRKQHSEWTLLPTRMYKCILV